jgi:peptidase E
MVKVTTPVALATVPEKVQKLLAEREAARVAKDYATSDALRAELLSLGYEVQDRVGGYELTKLGDRDQAPATSFLVLFGSGENAPSAVAIYRDLFLALGKRDLTLALITTPAGFQPNVAHVYGEIRDFLLAALPDFNLTIRIVRADTRADCDREEIVAELDGADVIFTGPGSPTYAVRTLRDTKVYTKIITQVKNGTSLILASAATITFSRHALPVYEIYKVGADLHWQDGLNLYKEIWEERTIIPHFNNTEGGATLDTTHCYIGKARAEVLLDKLPSTEKVIGIDEHTAMIVDRRRGALSVRGKGSLHQVK